MLVCFVREVRPGVQDTHCQSAASGRAPEYHPGMHRVIVVFIALTAVVGAARADGVFEVCKGESKTVVTGKGKMSIAVIYPDEFPVKTTPAMRNKVGARLAKAEKAKIVPAKDVFAAV